MSVLSGDSTLAEVLKNSSLGKWWADKQNNLKLREQAFQNQYVEDALAPRIRAEEMPQPDNGGIYKPVLDIRTRNMQAVPTEEPSAPSTEDLDLLMQDEQPQLPEPQPIPQASPVSQASAMALPSAQPETPLPTEEAPESLEPTQLNQGGISPLQELLTRRRDNIKNARLLDATGGLLAGVGGLFAGTPIATPDAKMAYDTAEDELEDFSMQRKMEEEEKSIKDKDRAREQEIKKLEEENQSKKRKEDPNSEISKLYRFAVREKAPNITITPNMTASQIEEVMPALKEVVRARIEFAKMAQAEERLALSSDRLEMQKHEAERREQRANRLPAQVRDRHISNSMTLQALVELRNKQSELMKRAGIIPGVSANVRRALNLDNPVDSAMRNEVADVLTRIVLNANKRLGSQEVALLKDSMIDLMDRGLTVKQVLSDLIDSRYRDAQLNLRGAESGGFNTQSFKDNINQIYTGEFSKLSRAEQEKAMRNFEETGSATGGKIVVSNGKQTFSIDPKDLADAEKDGFRRVQ
jgi:hypothetical protein